MDTCSATKYAPEACSRSLRLRDKLPPFGTEQARVRPGGFPSNLLAEIGARRRNLV